MTNVSYLRAASPVKTAVYKTHSWAGRTINRVVNRVVNSSLEEKIFVGYAVIVAASIALRIRLTPSETRGTTRTPKISRTRPPHHPQRRNHRAQATEEIHRRIGGP
jgi:hypothetical protein